MSKHRPEPDVPLQVPGARIAIVAARFNGDIVDALIDGARRERHDTAFAGDAHLNIVARRSERLQLCHCFFCSSGFLVGRHKRVGVRWGKHSKASGFNRNIRNNRNNRNILTTI